MNASRVLLFSLLMLTAVWANPTWAQPGFTPAESVPAAGATTHANNSDANVSSDWATKDVNVPNVVGLWRDEAILDLFKAGLRIGDIREETSTSVAHHHVISESPTAGTQVKEASKVDLVIARAPEVKVPDVVGLTLAAAKAALDKVDLNVGRIEEKQSSTVAAGLIISQHPRAGTTVREDRRVRLLVSKGASQTTVPNVIGATQAAATTAITSAGLIVGTVTNQTSATVATGLVISESPAAGSTVKSGSAVSLVVSTGVAKVTVPNVVGLTQAGATTAITGAGLAVGSVSTQNSSTVAAGLVISESPSAGSSVAANSAVSFVVSTGVAKVVVPNVVGKTQSVATIAITAIGLKVGTVTTQSSSTVAAGLVISESPGAGTSVALGSSVSISVSSGVPKVSVPNVVGLTQAAASAAIVSAGLTSGTVTTQSSATVASGLVISESPTAGSSVASGSAVSFIVSSGAAAQVFVDPNPGDSTIAIVNVAGKNLVTYTGAKTSTGIAQSIASVIVDTLDQAPANRVSVAIDSQGRPSAATLADGSSVKFNYVSATNITLTITDNEGEQGSFSFNPTTGTISSASAVLSPALTSSLKRASASPAAKRSSLTTNSTAQAATPDIGTVTVSCQDGTPISDATLVGTFIPNTVPPGIPTTFTLPVWPTMTTPGNYTYPVPAAAFPSNQNVLQALEASIPSLLTNYCSLSGQLDTLTRISIEAALSKQALSVYFIAVAPEAVVTAITAVGVACTATGILSAVNNTVTGIEVLESGGQFQFTATNPPAAPVSTASLSYGWLSPSPPSFAITFPCITLQIAPENPDVALGGTLQLSASGIDSNGKSGAISPTWSSLNESIATVNPAGLVAEYSVGDATIKVTDSISGTSTVTTVTVSPIALQISPTSPTVAVGSTTTLTVSATIPSGPIATPPNLVWKSLTESVATVAGGVVTGVSAGTATITVTDPVSLAIASVVVTVTPAQACAGITKPTFTGLFAQFPGDAPYVNDTEVFGSFCGIPTTGQLDVNIIISESLNGTLIEPPSPTIWNSPESPGPQGTTIVPNAWYGGPYAGGTITYVLTITVLWPDGSQQTQTVTFAASCTPGCT
jgi:beta-lactam-binding protein with PASTA domain